MRSSLTKEELRELGIKYKEHCARQVCPVPHKYRVTTVTMHVPMTSCLDLRMIMLHLPLNEHIHSIDSGMYKKGLCCTQSKKKERTKLERYVVLKFPKRRKGKVIGDGLEWKCHSDTDQMVMGGIAKQVMVVEDGKEVMRWRHSGTRRHFVGSECWEYRYGKVPDKVVSTKECNPKRCSFVYIAEKSKSPFVDKKTGQIVYNNTFLYMCECHHVLYTMAVMKKKVSRRKRTRNNFYNQVTLVIDGISTKLFKNGTMHFTGLPSVETCENVVKTAISEIHKMNQFIVGIKHKVLDEIYLRNFRVQSKSKLLVPKKSMGLLGKLQKNGAFRKVMSVVPVTASELGSCLLSSNVKFLNDKFDFKIPSDLTPISDNMFTASCSMTKLIPISLNTFMTKCLALYHLKHTVRMFPFTLSDSQTITPVKYYVNLMNATFQIPMKIKRVELAKLLNDEYDTLSIFAPERRFHAVKTVFYTKHRKHVIVAHPTNPSLFCIDNFALTEPKKLKNKKEKALKKLYKIDLTNFLVYTKDLKDLGGYLDVAGRWVFPRMYGGKNNQKVVDRAIREMNKAKMYIMTFSTGKINLQCGKGSSIDDIQQGYDFIVDVVAENYSKVVLNKRCDFIDEYVKKNAPKKKPQKPQKKKAAPRKKTAPKKKKAPKLKKTDPKKIGSI